MKQLTGLCALLLFFIFGCTKSNDLPTAATPTPSALEAPIPSNLDEAAADRGGCCCALVVSSTYFGGLTICGVYGEGDSCKLCTECGETCGTSITFPQAHNNIFCVDTSCPFCLTNNGFLPIQIYFICNGSPSTPVWIPAGGTICYTTDCSGTYTPCKLIRCE